MTRLGTEYIVRILKADMSVIKKYIVIASDMDDAKRQAVEEFEKNAPSDVKEMASMVEVVIR